MASGAIFRGGSQLWDQVQFSGSAASERPDPPPKIGPDPMIPLPENWT
jgi:hypothetical protein